MIRVTRARCINESDPSIWRGRLKNGDYYEAHYRSSRLQIWSGETPRAVFGGNLLLERRIVDPAPLGISFECLVRMTEGDMSWPDEDDGSATMWEPPARKAKA
jgi:hypothetical protein